MVASGSCPCNYDADDRLNDSRAGSRAIIVVSNLTAPQRLASVASRLTAVSIRPPKSGETDAGTTA